MTISGLQVGATGTTVVLTLSNGEYSFVSTPCRVVVSGAQVVCVAPPGVGAHHAVTVSVGGVSSPPFPNRTLSYAPPALASLVVASAVTLEGDGKVGTAGGSVVVLAGDQFGPAGLQPPSLNSVTFSPKNVLVTRGLEVRDCAAVVFWPAPVTAAVCTPTGLEGPIRLLWCSTA